MFVTVKACLKRSSLVKATVLLEMIGLLFLLREPLIECSQSIIKHHQPAQQPAATKSILKASRELKLAGNSRLNEIDVLRSRCNEAEKELDRCSAQLIAFGQSGALFPTNIETLDSVYCPNFRKISSCIRNNTDCYRPFERQIINWVLTSTCRMNHRRCKNTDEKQKFLRLTNSCFSLMKHPMDKCMSNYVVNLEGIAELDRYIERLTEDDVQIQLSCCANRRFKQCVMENAKQQCKPVDGLMKLKRTNSNSAQRMAQKFVQRATQDMMEDLKTTLDGMALTGPEFICSSVDEQFCRDRFDGRFNGRSPKHQSIVPAMIKIYSNK